VVLFLRKGIIIEFLAKDYVICDLETNKKIHAQVKGKIKNIKNNSNSDYSKIKVGDIVVFERKKNQFLIDSILPRTNELQRPNIANINQVLLVFSLKNPKFQFKLLDKFLIILQRFHLKIILIFTKTDLVEPSKIDLFKKKISYYEIFYKIFYINKTNKEELNVLYPFFKQQVTILAGQTGVGKSTLLNSLTSLNLKTQEVSKHLKRGKHTTKNSKLFFFHEGYIADTPGFSKLDLSDIKVEEIKNFYNDFVILSKECFFGYSCLHINENKCKVKEALKKGSIPIKRYNNYLSFVEEIKKKRNKFKNKSQ
jgi:ribosome biogenesis GTPase